MTKVERHYDATTFDWVATERPLMQAEQDPLLGRAQQRMDTMSTNLIATA